ncbi:MAG: GNAT family N-acetyltransferase [Acidobacteria bacterium]|nr:GNAT family N-acetyltransferase [Acidobacteriota bacterium]
MRELTMDDRPFIVSLLNQSSFLQFIGDKGVRNLEDARNYLNNGPIASYQKYGFGLWLVVDRVSNERLGMCGLLKRDTLEHPDLGYAFLESAWGKGYALEAAKASLTYGFKNLNIPMIVAITQPDNEASIRVLERCGMSFEKTIPPQPGDVALSLYVMNNPGNCAPDHGPQASP